MKAILFLILTTFSALSFAGEANWGERGNTDREMRALKFVVMVAEKGVISGSAKVVDDLEISQKGRLGHRYIVTFANEKQYCKGEVIVMNDGPSETFSYKRVATMGPDSQ